MNAMATNPGAWASALAIGVACLTVAGCGSDRSDNASSTTPVYSIEGNQVQLEGGFFESEDGIVSLLTAILGDLDGDGTLGQAKEAFIGDRIKFDFMDIYGARSVSPLTGVPIHPDDQGQLVVGYYIHGPEQAYAESPGVYIARHWKIESGRLVMVEDY